MLATGFSLPQIVSRRKIESCLHIDCEKEMLARYCLDTPMLCAESVATSSSLMMDWMVTHLPLLVPQPAPLLAPLLVP